MADARRAVYRIPAPVLAACADAAAGPGAQLQQAHQCVRLQRFLFSSSRISTLRSSFSRRQVSRLSSSNRAACFRTICSSISLSEIVAALQLPAENYLLALPLPELPTKASDAEPYRRSAWSSASSSPRGRLLTIRAAARLAVSASAHAASFSRSHACTHRKAAEKIISLSSCGGKYKHYRESEKTRARDLFFACTHLCACARILPSCATRRRRILFSSTRSLARSQLSVDIVKAAYPQAEISVLALQLPTAQHFIEELLIKARDASALVSALPRAARPHGAACVACRREAAGPSEQPQCRERPSGLLQEPCLHAPEGR